MIYATVGGHVQSFDRLIKKIDEIAPRLNERIILQKGVSRYNPQNVDCADYFTFSESEELIRKSKLVISHAGAGTIILARKHNVPIIVVPRRKEYNEHLSQHQVNMCDAINEEGREGVFVVDELDTLEKTVRELLSKPVNREALPSGRSDIIKELDKFIRDCCDLKKG